jgi:hypothetical protein
MTKKLRLLVSLGLFLAPAIAQADVSARQDSCVAGEGPAGESLLTVYFSVINFSLPGDVCSFTFVPEPQPPLPACTMIGCSVPAGWSCALNPDGGATWSSLGDCISAGEIVSEFDYTLDPGFCCYVVSFYDASGALLAVQEECFCDKPIQAESRTWGGVKAIYR